MLDGLDLDPYLVLGIGRDAGPDEVREAYRRQSKKHHPDHGGDEWAFRIVVRAYELLAGAPRRPQVPDHPDGFVGFPDPEADVDFGPARDWAAESERVRPGVHDRDHPPARIVLVEVLWLRLEVADIYALLDRREDSSFSGSIHLQWPDPGRPADAPMPGPDEARAILRGLAEVFDALRARPGVQNARSRADRDRFEAWVSFPSGQSAWSAFTAIRPGLKDRGLGVRQLTRDLTIPRDVGPA